MSFATLPYDIYHIITKFIVTPPQKINTSYQLKKEYTRLEPMLYLNKDIYNYYTVYSKHVNNFKERQQILKTKEAYYKVTNEFTNAVYDEIIKKEPSIMYSTYECQECKDIIRPKTHPTQGDEYCENENICYRCSENMHKCCACGIHITDRIGQLSDTERTYVCSYECHYAYKYCLDRYDTFNEDGYEDDTEESYRFKCKISKGCYNASYKKYYIEHPL